MIQDLTSDETYQHKILSPIGSTKRGTYHLKIVSPIGSVTCGGFEQMIKTFLEDVFTSVDDNDDHRPPLVYNDHWATVQDGISAVEVDLRHYTP